MTRWGIVEPILIDADRRVIAGHQILAAALELGLATVPTIALANLSDAQARALRIALNKLPELSSWDPNVLKDELAFLADFDIDLVSFTAFSSAELDVILTPTEDNPDDALPGPLKQAILSSAIFGPSKAVTASAASTS
ncbi:hypothetical protein [Methylobacterium mesophilicum]